MIKDDEPTIKLPGLLSGRPVASRRFKRTSLSNMRHSADEPTVHIAAPQPTFQQPPRQPQSIPPVQPPPQLPRGKKPRKRKRRPLRIALIVFLIFVGIFGSVLAYAYHYYDTTVNTPLQKFIHPVQRGKDEPLPNSAPSYNVVMGRSWNILLMGSDNDNKYTYPDVLTQVMMVIHIDTVNNSVSMVSIPRDSWVNVPNIGGMHKIDQAFFLGASQNNNFDDGVRQARLTIEKDYGITIDRYAWVGLSGFSKVIDTLGGVDVDVTHPIVDDNYPADTGSGSNPNDPYAYQRLYIAPGLQHLNGEQALEYVRSRHADLIGDIGRTQRQQQVLEALKKKLNLGSVVTDLPQLLKDMTGSVYTDLSEQEMLSFANFARTLSNSSIQRITLGPGTGSQDYGDLSSVFDPTIGANQDVMIPNCQNVQPTVNKIFGLGDVQSCNVTASQ
jgi:LCP family protein required for cell wall assembly